MKRLIGIEELCIALFAYTLTLPLGIAWWWFPVLFLAPDLSLLGYLLGPKAGAWTYNLVHHKGVAIAVFAAGAFARVPWLEFAGLLLLAHSSLDRVFGYGLKHTDAFQHTHLGMIGRTASR